MEGDEENISGIMDKNLSDIAGGGESSRGGEFEASGESGEHGVMDTGKEEEKGTEVEEGGADGGGVGLGDGVDLGAHHEPDFGGDDLSGEFDREEDQAHTEAHHESDKEFVGGAEDQRDHVAGEKCWGVRVGADRISEEGGDGDPDGDGDEFSGENGDENEEGAGTDKGHHPIVKMLVGHPLEI